MGESAVPRFRMKTENVKEVEIGCVGKQRPGEKRKNEASLGRLRMQRDHNASA